MKEIIDTFRRIVVQLATPYSTGTGFYLQSPGLIITSEHIVRDNREVVVKGQQIDRQLARVVFLDTVHDLAFLEPTQAMDLPAVSLRDPQSELEEGMEVMAMGHPFGLQFTVSRGLLTNTDYLQHDIHYLQHDAALNPGNSGGPLTDKEGKIIGVNAFDLEEGRSIGFALPVSYLHQSLADFAQGGGKAGARCFSCLQVVFESAQRITYCPHCGARILLPAYIEEYEPTGVQYTIEQLLQALGHTIKLARRGPNNWEIFEGSARISISYHEDSGLITGDAYLCQLPATGQTKLYEYLLRNNYEEEGLTFSVKGRNIILSLLIFDRYLNLETGQSRFKHLFKKADYYDNILVEEYGARWKDRAEEEE